MPYQTNSGTWTGQTNMATFMNDVWLPFVTTTMGWHDKNAAARGTTPNQEFWIGRKVASTASDGPYVFHRTTDRHMFTFSGDGINVAEEIFDQPNNPANGPNDAAFTPPGTNGQIASTPCMFLNSAVGPYQAYWLFGDVNSTYIHCVLKVSARQYRHFHVGLLQGLNNPGFDANSFYVTTHFWAKLGPEAIGHRSGENANLSHDPYSTSHHTPFQHQNDSNTPFISTRAQSRGNLLYMPGLITGKDWYHARTDIDTIDSRHTASSSPTTYSGLITNGGFKTVNAAPAIGFVGVANLNGYGCGMGAVLFSCNRTFMADGQPLIPLLVGVQSDFQSAVRTGVVAQFPDMFRVSMRNLSPEQEIPVGSDTYTVFPLINSDSQNVLAGEGYSAYEGIAYKKVTAAAVDPG